MSKEYQPKHTRDILPRAVYMKTIYQIRDYYRLKENLRDVVDEQPDPRQPHTAGLAKGSVVETKAIRREKDRDIISGIDEALHTIPQEYQHGVWQAVMYNAPYPKDADPSTYTRHKSRFIIMVARNLGFI